MITTFIIDDKALQMKKKVNFVIFYYKNVEPPMLNSIRLFYIFRIIVFDTTMIVSCYL